jgi:hypothetical protein
VPASESLTCAVGLTDARSENNSRLNFCDASCDDILQIVSVSVTLGPVDANILNVT